MGLGDGLMKIFGGENNYNYQMNPLLGSNDSIRGQSRKLGNDVTNAQFLNAPKHVLDFGANRGESQQQQQLINQILQQGQGQGPNPAMDQLRMTTDQNAMQGNALIASQRGINPALAARMAGQNMAAGNQQAAGQAALMSAQQQLGAQQLGGQMLGQRIGQQSQNAIAQGQAGLGVLGARLGAEQSRRQAQQNYQNMVGQNYQEMNKVNAGVAAQNAQTAGGYGGDTMTGGSSAIGGLIFHDGGQVPNPFQNHVAQKLADGGTAGAFMSFQGANPMENFLTPRAPSNLSGLSSGLTNILNSAFNAPQSDIGNLGKSPSLLGMQGPSAIGMNVDRSAGYGANPIGMPAWQRNAMLPRSELGQATISGSLGDFSMPPALASQGGKVNGQAQVKGDSEANDVVPAMLSPGEVVIPRTAMQNAESAHNFLDKIIQKHDGPSYKKILEAKSHYHNMAHGGAMDSCKYCGGMV